jgi:hypothetical protein
MRVSLGKFAQREIEARLGPDLVSGVDTALRHYARRLASGSAPVALPRFSHAGGEAGPVDLDLAIGHDVEQALAREVGGQGSSLGQLLTHAILVYLADLDRSAEPSEPPKSFS